MTTAIELMDSDHDTSHGKTFAQYVKAALDWFMKPAHPRLHVDELSPHLARDIGLADDGEERPSASPGVLGRSPRL